MLYNLGVLYEDNERFDKAAECFRRLAKADPLDDRARLFCKDAEAALTMYYSPDEEQVSVQFRLRTLSSKSVIGVSITCLNCTLTCSSSGL